MTLKGFESRPIEGAELEKLIAEDKARDAAVLGAAQAQQDAFYKSAMDQKKSRQTHTTISNSVFDNFSAEAGAGMKQLAQLGWVDAGGIVTQAGRANGITDERISQFLADEKARSRG